MALARRRNPASPPTPPRVKLSLTRRYYTGGMSTYENLQEIEKRAVDALANKLSNVYITRIKQREPSAAAAADINRVKKNIPALRDFFAQENYLPLALFYGAALKGDETILAHLQQHYGQQINATSTDLKTAWQLMMRRYETIDSKLLAEALANSFQPAEGMSQKTINTAFSDFYTSVISTMEKLNNETVDSFLKERDAKENAAGKLLLNDMLAGLAALHQQVEKTLLRAPRK